MKKRKFWIFAVFFTDFRISQFKVLPRRLSTTKFRFTRKYSILLKLDFHKNMSYYWEFTSNNYLNLKGCPCPFHYVEFGFQGPADFELTGIYCNIEWFTICNMYFKGKSKHLWSGSRQAVLPTLTQPLNRPPPIKKTLNIKLKFSTFKKIIILQ